jgi:hypothetical protein
MRYFHLKIVKCLPCQIQFTGFLISSIIYDLSKLTISLICNIFLAS